MSHGFVSHGCFCAQGVTEVSTFSLGLELLAGVDDDFGFGVCTPAWLDCVLASKVHFRAVDSDGIS